MATDKNKKNYTYQDIIRINNRRKKSPTMSIKTIEYLDFESGQIICKAKYKPQDIDSIEHFLFDFIKNTFIIENPEVLFGYNFDNLRLYTNPEEFEKDLTYALDNAILFGMNLTFNSFILKLTDDGWEVTGCLNKAATVLIIPEFITSIGERAFREFHKLKIVRLPNRLKAIKNMAFYYCDMLKGINLPKNLEYIGDKAFHSCEELDIFDFPKSLEHIGKEAFKYSKLTEIILPEKITVIEDGTFAFAALQRVTLPKNLKIIKCDAFEHCSIKELNIQSVEIIYNSAFFDCDLVGCIKLPKNLKKFYTTTFAKNSIETIYIPEGAELYRDSYCDSLAACGIKVVTYKP